MTRVWSAQGYSLRSGQAYGLRNRSVEIEKSGVNRVSGRALDESGCPIDCADLNHAIGGLKEF